MSHSKNILLVSRSFYPQNSPRSFRTSELAKEFSRQGHNVTVITPRNHEHHKWFEQEYKVKIKDLGTPKWKSIDLKGKGVIMLYKRMVKRLSQLLFEYPGLELLWMVKNTLKDESGYDLLISIAVPYPIHWGVAAIWTKKDSIAKLWVADCGDPYMGQENDTFKPPFYFVWVEKWFCRKADYITVPTLGAVKAYYPEFHDKIKVIPQGFNFDDIKIHHGDPVYAKPVFAYAGSFIPGRRDPSEFLEFINSLDKDFEFHLYTTTPQWVSSFIAQSKGRVILKDLLPREKLLNELSKVDFVVNFENIGSKQTPSKLIDYAIIKKPILSIKTGNLQKDTVIGFIEGDYRNQMIIDDPDSYRIENVTEKFLNLLNG